MRQKLEELADRNATDLTEEIRLAIRHHLEAAGLWGPEGQDSRGA
jgi:hypothetical protein